MCENRNNLQYGLHDYEGTSVQTGEYCETDENDKLRELQLLEFEMLKKITEICVQNNLRYYLAEGTLLGAVRHHGFIPWDDDLDICMPREDFEKFIEIAPHELPDRYIYRLQHDEGLWGTLEVLDTNPEICGTLNEQELHLVDIFPVDGFPKSKLKQKVHWIKILFRHCMLRFVQIDYIDKNKRRGFFWESAIKIAAMLPLGKFIDEQKAFQRLTDTLKKYAFSDSEMIIIFNSEYSIKSFAVPKTIMPKSYFGDGRSALFEGESLCIPSQAEKVLETEYGDYMTLPPLEERKQKHNMKLIS